MVRIASAFILATLFITGCSETTPSKPAMKGEMKGDMKGEMKGDMKGDMKSGEKKM